MNYGWNLVLYTQMAFTMCAGTTRVGRERLAIGLSGFFNGYPERTSIFCGDMAQNDIFSERDSGWLVIYKMRETFQKGE